MLFDRLFYLHSLIFFLWSIENIFSFEIKYSTIYQLDLRGPNLIYNEKQCLELSHSSIGQQCQVLFINVEQQTNIIDLINNMNNLRALIVKCSKILKENDNLIQWLEQYLPFSCAISNLTEIDDHVRLWIR